MKSSLVMIASFAAVQAGLQEIAKQENSHCDLSQQNIWYKSYGANEVRGGYREE